MAHIKNSISMQDHMTPVFKSIIKSMDSTLRAMQQLDKQADKEKTSKAFQAVEKDIQKANNALIKMQNNLQKVDSTASTATGSVSSMASATKDVSFDLINFSAALYLVENIAEVFGSMFAVADNALSSIARLNIFNESAYSAETLYGEIYRTAMATRTDLKATADFVNRTLVADIFQGPGSAQSAIKFAELVNKTMISGGTSKAESERALLQFSHALASGNLQGLELRSITKQTPYLTTMLAEGLAKVDDKFKGISSGSLKQLGTQGELTADRLVKAMFAMSDEIDSVFGTMPRTFTQAMTQIKSTWGYILSLLYKADGPLGRLNEKLWQFIDWLETPAGVDFIDNIIRAFNLLTEVVIWTMDKLGKAYTLITENSPIAETALISLGAVAVAWGIKTAIAWISAAWPILLVAGLVGGVAYAFLKTGATVEEVVGYIVGALYVVVDMVLNVLVGVAWILARAIVDVYYAVRLAIEGVVQLFIWMGISAIGVFRILKNSGITLGESLLESVKLGIVGIARSFVWLQQSTTKVLSKIADAFDSVFGSNLAKNLNIADTVWDISLNALEIQLSNMKGEKPIGDLWKDDFEDLLAMYKGEGQYYKYNRAPQMFKLMNDHFNKSKQINENAQAMLTDPRDSWERGYDAGVSIVDFFDDLSFDSLSKLLDEALPDEYETDIKVKGGTLDSIGKINSPVEIKDEDLKLLRDMAARDFLLNLQSITPVANVSFGDVRETADVNQIWGVIQDMIEDQLAASFVAP